MVSGWLVLWAAGLGSLRQWVAGLSGWLVLWAAGLWSLMLRVAGLWSLGTLGSCSPGGWSLISETLVGWSLSSGRLVSETLLSGPLGGWSSGL